MTTLMSEIFAGTEVIFVNDANPRNFQMTGDSFSQMKLMGFGCFFVCMWCIRGYGLRWGGVVGRGIIFPMVIFKVDLFQFIICKVTLFPA